MVQLPYKGQDIVMLIMLPHENSPSALQAVRMRCLVWCGVECLGMLTVCIMVQVVSEENLRKINHNQRSMQQSEVNIKLPRFKFEYEVELADLLQEMGISLPFTSDADFSAMVAPGSPAECVHHSSHARTVQLCACVQLCVCAVSFLTQSTLAGN
jgi:serine protease inhibitor